MPIPDETRHQLAVKFAVLLPHLDERERRLLMAAEARGLGHGGVRAVAQAAAVSETTVRKGVFELEAGEEPLGRVRRPGGGRRRVADLDPGLRPALLALVEPDVRGDPMSPLRWTVKSTRTLARELTGRSGSPGGFLSSSLVVWRKSFPARSAAARRTGGGWGGRPRASAGILATRRGRPVRCPRRCAEPGPAAPSCWRHFDPGVLSPRSVLLSSCSSPGGGPATVP